MDLPAPEGPTMATFSPGADAHRDLAQDGRLAGRVAEVDVLELDGPAQPAGIDGARGLGRRGEDVVEPLEVDAEVLQLADRLEERLEGDMNSAWSARKETKVPRVMSLGDDLLAADQEHQGGAGPCKEHREVPGDHVEPLLVEGALTRPVMRWAQRCTMRSSAPLALVVSSPVTASRSAPYSRPAR